MRSTDKTRSLRLESLEARDTPASFGSPVANVISQSAINGNTFQVQINGDFDGGGTANDSFFWSPTTGQNRLILNTDTENPTITSNVISSASINNNAFRIGLTGDMDGNGADDLFFWNPQTGSNRMFSGLDGVVSRANDFINPRSINNNDFGSATMGNFGSGSTDELFFWNSSTGQNRLISGFTDAAQSILNNPISQGLINGFTSIVGGAFSNDAGGFDDLFFLDRNSGFNRLISGLGDNSVSSANNLITPSSLAGGQFSVTGGNVTGTGSQLFFWNPLSGTNRFVTGLDTGTPSIENNAISPTTIGNNAFSTLGNGLFGSGSTNNSLFFWNPQTGANSTFSYLTPTPGGA